MELIRHLFDSYGSALVFLNAFVHEAGLPVPLSPTVIVAAGWYASVGGIAMIVATVAAGSTLGNAIWFYAGRRFGTPVLRTLCRVSLSPDTCVAKTSGAFEKWGGSLLVIGRFIPGVSLITPPLAGMTGMSWTRFLALTLAGSAIWALVIALLGVMLQSFVDAAIGWIYRIPAGVWATPLVVLAGYVAYRLYRRHRASLMRNVPRIEITELEAQVRSGTPPAIIDVRGPVMRAAEEAVLRGAINLSLEEIELADIATLASRRVVIFCGCPNEASAAVAALKLRARGVTFVYVLRGGIDALKAAGLALVPKPGAGSPDVESGRAATSLSTQASSGSP